MYIHIDIYTYIYIYIYIHVDIYIYIYDMFYIVLDPCGGHYWESEPLLE